MSQKQQWCRHFNGVQNKICKDGVEYAAVKDKSTRPCGLPCIDPKVTTCGAREYRTAEEETERERKSAERIVNLMKCLDAVTTDAKKHGFKKGNGGSGAIECPCCGEETLRYTVSSYNGHIGGRCANKCAAWQQ